MAEDKEEAKPEEKKDVKKDARKDVKNSTSENAVIESAQQDIRTRQDEKREKNRRDTARKKRRLIPPAMMLTAGAVSSIIMFFMRYETKRMLVILLVVLIVFYVLGCLIRFMFDSFAMQNEAKADAEGEVIDKTDEDESSDEKNDKTGAKGTVRNDGNPVKPDSRNISSNNRTGKTGTSAK